MAAMLDWAQEALGPTVFHYVLSPALKIAVLLVLVLTLIAYTTFAERKILGFLQVRTGPNRVGPWGLLQPLADVAKLLVKQDIIPDRAVRWAFVLAPCLVVGPALVIFSVIPFGPSAETTGNLNWFITDVNVALLFVVAMATIGVYGIILGGWSSNNKFSLLGGLRSAAQMISYEVPQGFSLVVPLLMAGTMSLTGIVDAQLEQHFAAAKASAPPALDGVTGNGAGLSRRDRRRRRDRVRQEPRVRGGYRDGLHGDEHERQRDDPDAQAPAGGASPSACGRTGQSMNPFHE